MLNFLQSYGYPNFLYAWHNAGGSIGVQTGNKSFLTNAICSYTGFHSTTYVVVAVKFEVIRSVLTCACMNYSAREARLLMGSGGMSPIKSFVFQVF